MGSFPLKVLVRQLLSQCFLAEGGIADRVHGQFRTDATAWGILALHAAGEEERTLEKHRARLVDEQLSDGRVPMDRRHAESFWPTPLAILAWQHSLSSREAQQLAIAFMLNTTGVHVPRKSDDTVAHDPSLRGWPWVGGTHSWIEPTVLAIMALKATGHADHIRVHEATRMIIDRQLPHGGWNYGNSFVFRQELRPMPENTGAALLALTGSADQAVVARSLLYLQGEMDRLRTPVSLGWSLLGLSAWGVRPPNCMEMVERCLANRARFGEYDTSALCLLFLGALAGDPDSRFGWLPGPSKSSNRGVPSQLGLS